MAHNPNRVIYCKGKTWVKYLIDGFGPDTNHRYLTHAIQRAAHCIRKLGEGHLTIKDGYGDDVVC